MRRYLTAKAQWIATRPDIDHVIVVSGPADSETVWHRSRVYRVAGPRVPASPGYHMLLAPRTVRRIVEYERPDIIELGSVYLAPWLLRYANRNVGARVAAMFHMDLRGVVARHALRRVPNPFRRWADRRVGAYVRAVYGRADCVVAASPAAQRALAESGVHGVTLVPLGVDVETFRPDVRDAAWRRTVVRQDGGPLGLYVGRFATEKGVRTLLAALPELHRATGLTLLMVGEGHLRGELEAFSTRHPEMLQVRPYVSDSTALARCYASADLYFAPFPYETFGLAIAEAMASGLPVVAVDAGAAADLVDGAPWGTTYPAGDRVALVRAARQLLAGDRDALRSLVRRHVERHYTWNRTFTRLFDLYAGLVTTPSLPIAEPVAF